MREKAKVSGGEEFYHSLQTSFNIENTLTLFGVPSDEGSDVNLHNKFILINSTLASRQSLGKIFQTHQTLISSLLSALRFLFWSTSRIPLLKTLYQNLHISSSLSSGCWRGSNSSNCSKLKVLQNGQMKRSKEF